MTQATNKAPQELTLSSCYDCPFFEHLHFGNPECHAPNPTGEALELTGDRHDEVDEKCPLKARPLLIRYVKP